MSTAMWGVATFFTVLPLALYVLVLRRSRYLENLWTTWVGALFAASLLATALMFAEHAVERWADIAPLTDSGDPLPWLLYGVFVTAPIEMIAVMLAAFPFWRMRRIHMRAGVSRKLETQEGVCLAASAALGLATVRNVAFLLQYGTGWLSIARTMASLATFVLLCALWGYVLGRNAHRGMRGRRFGTAVFAATLFSAVYAQLAYYHGSAALLTLLPLLASMCVVSLVLWREQVGQPVSSGGPLSRMVASAPAPSIEAIREAFRQQERPLTLRWISFGALVTVGLITAGLVIAIWAGHEIGLDFSAVDRQQTNAASMAPLAILALGVLGAFPVSGFLLARASGTTSVLEPAMASAVAMVLVMVLLGMVAPVSVVFAIAFAPIAFALACTGAWLAL